MTFWFVVGLAVLIAMAETWVGSSPSSGFWLLLAGSLVVLSSAIDDLHKRVDSLERWQERRQIADGGRLRELEDRIDELEWA